MKFDFKKIIFLCFATCLLNPHMQAMEQLSKKLEDLSPVQLHQYKTVLYAQFCAVQQIKKKFFEVQAGKPQFHGIQFKEDDELEGFDKPFENLKGIFLKDKDFFSLHTQVGNWTFLKDISYNANTIHEDFWPAIYAAIHATFYETHSEKKLYQKAINGAHYYEHTAIYKIEKTVDGTPIPVFPFNVELTDDQRQKIWDEMKMRYQRLKHFSDV